MCFHIDSLCKQGIAEAPIVCYKIGGKEKLNMLQKLIRKPKFISDVMHHKYTLGKRQENIKLCPNADGDITFGYHSFATPDAARYWKYDNLIKVQCIIPKGAEYYYDPYLDLYVSSSIIIKDFID